MGMDKVGTLGLQTSSLWDLRPFRYLCLDLVSEGLLSQHQRYLRGLHGVPYESPDLAPSIPHLRLACYLREPRAVAATELSRRFTLSDLTVEILKPVRFQELQSRCRPEAVGSFDFFCVFGVNPRSPTSASRNFLPRRGGNLLQLIVAEGAGILPPSDCRTQGRRSWNVATCGVIEDAAGSLSLVLEDPIPTSLTASTIDFCLEFLEFGRTATIDKWASEPLMVIKCYPSVFASFVSLVSDARSPADGADEIRSDAARSGKDDSKSRCHIDRQRGLRRQKPSALDHPGGVGVSSLGSADVERQSEIHYLELRHACPSRKCTSFARSR